MNDIKIHKMQLVIDANIVISAIISSAGKTADLIFSEDIELIAPEFGSIINLF